MEKELLEFLVAELPDALSDESLSLLQSYAGDKNMPEGPGETIVDKWSWIYDALNSDNKITRKIGLKRLADEIDAIRKVFKSGNSTSGPETNQYKIIADALKDALGGFDDLYDKTGYLNNGSSYYGNAFFDFSDEEDSEDDDFEVTEAEDYYFDEADNMDDLTKNGSGGYENDDFNVDEIIPLNSDSFQDETSLSECFGMGY